MTNETTSHGAPRAVCFSLCAQAEPGVLPRILQTLARRDITPERVTAKRAGDRLHVDVVLRDARPEDSHQVHGNLRQIVGVYSLRREDMVLSRTPSRPERPAVAWHQGVAPDMKVSAEAGGFACP